MANKLWSFQLDDGPHIVALKHNYFSVELKVADDGKLFALTANQQRKTFDFGSDIPLDIASHRCDIHIYNNGVGYEYDFSIEGRSVSAGKPMMPLQIPVWAWLFITACIVMPFFSIFGVFTAGAKSSHTLLLGALPGSVAAVCAYMCYMIARIPTRSEGTRLVICVAITALCWGLFFVLLAIAYNIHK